MEYMCWGSGETGEGVCVHDCVCVNLRAPNFVKFKPKRNPLWHLLRTLEKKRTVFKSK